MNGNAGRQFLANGESLNKRTVTDEAQECLNAQDAVNLSGVVHSMSRAVSTLWNQPEASETGTTWVNEHPIMKLYVDKLVQLSGSTRDYAEDYARVRMLAGHGVASASASADDEHRVTEVSRLHVE